MLLYYSSGCCHPNVFGGLAAGEAAAGLPEGEHSKDEHYAPKPIYFVLHR